MLDMVSKYTKNFSVHTGSRTVVAATEDVVLITGVTGAIGSNVLAQLVKLPKVSKIFAITRKSATLSIERLKSGLTDRGLDPLVVDSSKVVVVDGDLTLPSLGLTSQLLDEVRCFSVPL
jgi:thioester reductase-like protein